MKKYVITLLVALLFVPAATFAATPTEITQAQYISVLLKYIDALKQQIIQLQDAPKKSITVVQKVAAPSPAPTPSLSSQINDMQILLSGKQSQLADLQVKLKATVCFYSTGQVNPHLDPDYKKQVCDPLASQVTELTEEVKLLSPKLVALKAQQS